MDKKRIFDAESGGDKKTVNVKRNLVRTKVSHGLINVALHDCLRIYVDLPSGINADSCKFHARGAINVKLNV